MNSAESAKPDATEQAQTIPDSPKAPETAGHSRHCFVVMPYGHTPEENRWFRGWYEVVIQPAVAASGYVPVLAAAEEHPGAINDDIRSHLAFDPMVVVDLGGMDPDDDPNPNVMYELGIRHALGLPLVMTAWRGQRLPFDVGNQRVIMEGRDLIDIETNKKRLASFIRGAAEGKYYRPMDAVGRYASIEAATLSLGEDSVLRALVQEIRDLRASLSSAANRQAARSRAELKVKRLLKGSSRAARPRRRRRWAACAR